jgi:hypothetical protein
MAAGPIFNAIADLTRVNQHRTIERIVALSGATTSAVVSSLKTNAALLVMADNNVSLNIGNTAFETAQATIATSWNGS